MSDEAERRLLSQIGAHESWARTTNRSARTAPAREALMQKFLDEADGDEVRAAHLRKAYFQRLALKSAQSRRARRPAGERRFRSFRRHPPRVRAKGGQVLSEHDRGRPGERAASNVTTSDLLSLPRHGAIDLPARVRRRAGLVAARGWLA